MSSENIFTSPAIYGDDNNTLLGKIAAAAQSGGGGGTGPTTNPVTISQGGTGQITVPLARAALGAAVSGANNDITSLSGLTTALSVAQGGTGATTASAARTNLGIVRKRVSADQTITSTTGNTPITDLAIAVVAGEVWTVEVGLFAVVESTAPGIVIAVTTTGTVSSFRCQTTYIANGSANIGAGTQTTEATTGIDRVIFSYPGVSTDPMFIRAFMDVVVTGSGTLNINFAQAVSSADDTTIRRGSFINAVKQ